MISENGKVIVVRYILDWASDLNKSWHNIISSEPWNRDSQWLNECGEVWAKTVECQKYIERYLKLKAFL